MDMAGSIVRMSDILNLADNTYIPDALHDMRFAIAYWSHVDGGNDAALIAARAESRLGTFKIDLALALWAREGAELPSTPFKCNIDSMVHKQKGVVGLFLQEVFRFSAERVTVSGTLNQGRKGPTSAGSTGTRGTTGTSGTLALRAGRWLWLARARWGSTTSAWMARMPTTEARTESISSMTCRRCV